MTDDPRIKAGRIAHVRDVCARSMEHDAGKAGVGALTNRAWLAETVLAILDGAIDEQIWEEISP